MAFSIYIFVLSVMSPCPPFVNSWMGPLLSVISWILSQSIFMRVRCLVAARLQRFGQRVLLTLGALTMIGRVFVLKKLNPNQIFELVSFFFKVKFLVV